MAVVLIAMMPGETGHLNCAFALADRLTRRGHSVVFIGIEADAGRVLSRGHVFRPIAREALPGRQLTEWKQRADDGEFRGLRGLARLMGEFNQLFARLRAYKRAVIEQGTESDSFTGDLVICDEMNPLVAMLAWFHRVPIVQLATSLPPDRRNPNFWSGSLPGSAFFGARSTAQWLIRHLASRPGSLVGSLLLRRAGLGLHSLIRDFSLPEGLISGADLRMNLPTLVACPEAFASPCPSAGDHLFIEPLVDEERDEPAFAPFEHWPEGLRIYASMGSQQLRAAQPILQALVEAAETRPDWSVLISSGGATDVRPRSANVRVVAAAPQLRVLAEADLMVSHCGLNSVKECITRGVPVIGFPLRRDQPGVAARLVVHGLGLIATRRDCTPAGLTALIERLAQDEGLGRKVAEMRRVFAEMEADGPGIELIDRCLATSASGLGSSGQPLSACRR